VTLYSTLAEICSVEPDYVSVTYGAGGSTREKTVDLVRRIQNELKIETMAHLTCVGHSKSEIKNVLDDLKNANINNIIALRGDPPKGETEFKPHPDGFPHASDLIKFIRSGFDFKIAAACYPEMHTEAISLDKDIEYLKLKQDNGAEFTITQLFFDNTDFYRFREKAVQKGVTIPIIAGIMPVSSISQLKRFEEMAGAKIPKKLIDTLNQGSDVIEQGIQYGVQQCKDLLESDVAGIHLYTLNKSISSVKITQGLRQFDFFPQAEVPNQL